MVVDLFVILIIFSWRERVRLLALVLSSSFEMVRELWVALFRLFGVEWILPRKVIKLLASLRDLVGSRNILEVWRMALMRLI